uniref:Uncharacterized protein n=1 Tax=Schizaphis graminum TaxID=13262 RepID=A0A2S2P1X9_SCHGA
MHHEIKLRMCAANRSYFAMKEMFSSKLLSRRTKERLYITYLLTVTTYAYETWASTKGDEEKLSSFERKILRKIYGPEYNVNSGIFEIRKNDEIQRHFNNPSICQFVRSKRIEWVRPCVPGRRMPHMEGYGGEPNWKETPWETTPEMV